MERQDLLSGSTDSSPNPVKERDVPVDEPSNRGESMHTIAAGIEFAVSAFPELLDALDCIVFESDCRTWEFTYVNRAAERILGYPLDSWFGDPAFWVNMIHPEDRDQAIAFCAARTQEGGDYRFEYRAIAADGRVVWISDIVHVVMGRDGAPRSLWGVMIDITETKRMQEALRESDELFRSTFEQVAVGMAHVSANGKYLRVNRKLSDMTGYTPAELLSVDFQSITHEDDLEPSVTFLRQLLSGERETGSLEKRYLRKDGSYFWVNITTSLKRDAEGEPSYFISVFQDISDRKLAEAQLHELNETLEKRVAERTEELRRANERLEAEIRERRRAEADLLKSNRELEAFAYAASHDLQEPLRKISSFVDLLKTDPACVVDKSGNEYLDRIQTSALRMTHLIRDLLAYARVRTNKAPFRLTDLNSVLRNVLSDLDVALAEVEGRVELEALPALEADPTQMHQLFQNLIGNSLKFHRDGVPPQIRIRALPENGRLCIIEVSDNGIGFENRFSDRIFAPFQRLHDRRSYPGTGIGLAICQKIAEHHGGSITASGTPGVGSTFIIELPLSRAES